MKHVIAKGSLEVGDRIHLHSGPGVVEMLTYQLERPDGKLLAMWRVPSYVKIYDGPAVTDDGFWLDGQVFNGPWVLRGRRSTEDFWVTIAERPDSPTRSSEGDQAPDPTHSPM